MISIMVLAPVYSAVSCGMVVGLSLQDCLSREERDLKRILLVYLSVSATGWLVTFLLSVLSLVVCPAQRGLPALFRLAVYLLLPDRPFPHEAGRAGGIPASPLTFCTRAAGAGDVGLVVLRAFRRAAGDREGESGGDSRGVRVVYPLFYPQAPAEGCFRPLVLYPYAGVAGILLRGREGRIRWFAGRRAG